MHRVISAFRLLPPKLVEPGPLRPGSDGKVPSEAVGDFLNATYIAVERMRMFGLSDADFGGKIEIAERGPGEKANGRYFPKTDKSVIFYPPIHGAPDYPWTIIHELMHRIWVKHLSEESKELWSLICQSIGKDFDNDAADAMVKVVKSKPNKSSLWFYFRKHFGNDLSGFRRWLKTRKVSDSFPSQYASSEPAEAFSEVAANIILGRGHAGREINRTGSVIRKVFLSMVEPLRYRASGRIFEDVALEDHDENFLQTQVDFGYLRIQLPRWIAKNIPEDNILKVEHRPHVTVYYGADKRDLPLIEKIVKDYGRPIRVMLGAFNIFEHPEQDVLYIEVVGDSVRELHDEIAKLPHTRPPTHDDYTPHLTVAYLKKGTGRKYVGTTPFRMVASARGVSVIDAAGIEQSIRAIPEMDREPLLLAGG